MRTDALTLTQVRQDILRPAFRVLPALMDSSRAELLLLAIGLQESRFTHRKQIGGPARGFWQFEEGGGVRGVLTHHATRDLYRWVCKASGASMLTQDQLYTDLATNDVLAAVMARLLLWTHSKPLPAVGEVQQAWEYYIDLWRPGKPHRSTWNSFYAMAMDEILFPEHGG